MFLGRNIVLPLAGGGHKRNPAGMRDPILHTFAPRAN